MNTNFLDKKNKQFSKSNKKISSYLKTKERYLKDLEKTTRDITDSKAFKFWQKFQKVKRLINPKTYFRFIKNKVKKYKYNLSDFETPHHGFIILKTKTSKWKTSGYEKVGEDWHIRIIRKIDEKEFLLDQSIFYYLQIFNDKSINLEKELFITYGTTNEKLKKIKKAVESIKLC